MEARIEDYLDAELPPPERAVFERRLAAEERWASEVHQARWLRAQLRELPQPSCPSPVTAAVLAEARREAEASPAARVREEVARWGAVLWRPSLAAAGLSALILAAAFLGRMNQQVNQTPHPAEVEHAEAEVKWVLAYLSEVGRQAGASVRQDVFEDRVLAPVQQVLGTVIEKNSGAEEPEAEEPEAGKSKAEKEEVQESNQNRP